MPASPTDAVPVDEDAERGADEAPRSFEQVYAAGFAFVWRCLRSLGVADAALDDAAQDVFLVVHRQLAGFRGHSAIKTWLYGIVRNVASNHRRSVKRKAVPEDLAEVDPIVAAPAPGPLELLQEVEAAAFVRTFLAGTREKQRDVFVLAVLEDLSVPEVARALGIPLNTAYTRLRRVRADFRRALSRRGKK